MINFFTIEYNTKLLQIIFSNWWPFFVIAFYIISPIPSIFARRLSDDSGSRNPCKELAYFLTAGIVVSAFGLPIILARAPREQPVVSLDFYCVLLIYKAIIVRVSIMYNI